MSDGIYTEDNELITTHIRDALPTRDGVKVINKLLDGSYHIETIGVAGQKLLVVTLGDRAVRNRINLAEAVGEKIMVTALGYLWHGYIEEPVTWQESAVNYYLGDVTLLIESVVEA